MLNTEHFFERMPLLKAICADLKGSAQAHTILLYGSRANGSETVGSDYDIAAFGNRTETQRDTRMVLDEFVDVFLYPTSVLALPTTDHLHLRHSVVLLQRQQEADAFLAGLDTIYVQGPAPLAADEIAARKAWAWKMVRRLARKDMEGNYRRVWLLTALLEDYFVLRGQWFEGPKKSIQWLEAHDASTHLAFEAALRPDATITDIRSAVERVTGEPGEIT